MYLYCVISRNSPLCGGEYAYYARISNSKNLAKMMDGVNAFQIFPTKREAIETARLWNESYRQNGLNTGLVGETA